MKRFVLGDIHGEYEYLIDVLKKSGFRYKEDLLIQIGDIVDRGPEPFKCMDELLKIKNLVLIAGNHDLNFIEYMNSNRDFLGSYAQNGTHTTVGKWKKLSQKQCEKYRSLIFDKMIPYHLTSDNMIFTHGGFPRDERLEDIEPDVFAWDRELVMQAMSCKGKQKLKTLYDFKKIFIGHTPTIYWNETKPIYSGGVWNVDTGSGKSGPLTIMNVDTEEYWQSDHNFLKDKHVVIKGTETDSEEQEEESDKDYKEAA